MRALETLLIIAVVVLLLFAFLVGLTGAIKDWAISSSGELEESALYSCEVVLDSHRDDPMMLMVYPPVWASSEGEALNAARGNGFRVLHVLIWREGQPSPQRLW